MRFSRQAVWVLLAGAFVCASVVATRAGLPATRSREPFGSHWSAPAAGQTTVGSALPLDDDDPSDAPGPGRGTLRPEPRATHHPVVASRAPVTTSNGPSLQRRKLPEPAGDDVPAH